MQNIIYHRFRVYANTRPTGSTRWPQRMHPAIVHICNLLCFKRLLIKWAIVYYRKRILISLVFPELKLKLFHGADRPKRNEAGVDCCCFSSSSLIKDSPRDEEVENRKSRWFHNFGDSSFIIIYLYVETFVDFFLPLITTRYS